MGVFYGGHQTVRAIYFLNHCLWPAARPAERVRHVINAGRPVHAGALMTSSASVVKFRRLPSGFIVNTGADGDAVTHPALTRLPFERSIESWVRACFPDATYVQRASPFIDASDLDLLRARGVVAVQGAKGLGKSKAVRAAVAALPESTTAVQITFRRSLAWASADLLGARATLYSAAPRGALSARQHPRLTILVNSIARVRGTYDVVVIDELVSVLDALASTLLSATCRVAALSTLASLVASARVVVVADAVLDAAALSFVLQCRRMPAAAAATEVTAAASQSLRVLDYVHRCSEDHVYVAHASDAAWQTALDEAVAAGQKVVVPCLTKARAVRVAARYQNVAAVQLYTADVDPEHLHAAMSDIHGHWGRAHVLVYSPVITAGCSFELPHFDVVFFYGMAGFGTVRSAVQMIARVRSVSTKTVHVFLARADAGGMAMPSDAALALAPTPAPAPVPVPTLPLSADDVLMALLEHLEHLRAEEDALVARSFPYCFWALVAHSGARIAFPKAHLLPLVPPTLLSGCPEDGSDDGSDETGGGSDDHCHSSAANSTSLHADAAEGWQAHDWAATDDTGLHAYPLDGTSAVRVHGTLLQRAHMAHPTHCADAGLIPRDAVCAGFASPCRALTITRPRPCADVAATCRPQGGGACARRRRGAAGSGTGSIVTPVPLSATLPFEDMDPEVAEALRARVRAWAALLAQKGVRMVGKPQEKRTPSEARAMLMGASPFPGAVTLFPPPCLSATLFSSAALEAACRKHGHRYMDASCGWMDVVRDAWVLAGMDQAVRSRSPVCGRVLEDVAPGVGIAHAMQISDRVTTMVRAARPRWVGVNVPVGCGTGALAMVDFVVLDDGDADDTDADDVDVDGSNKSCLHFMVCRTCGFADASALDRDVLKLLALVAAHSVTSKVPVASVRVLFPFDDEVAQVNTRAWDPSGLRAALLSRALLSPWDVDCKVVYALYDSDSRTWDVAPDGHRLTEGRVTIKAAAEPCGDDDDPDPWDALWDYSGARGKRLITWGWTLHEALPPPPRDVAANTCDVGLAIASRLFATGACIGGASGAATSVLTAMVPDMACARVTSGRPGAFNEPSDDGSSMERLRDLYHGILSRGMCVYFWNSRPHGVAMRVLPSLAFVADGAAAPLAAPVTP